MLLAASSGRAQVPAPDEMAAAFRAAEPQARLAGLALQPGALWWAAWRERSPLVAGYSRGVCQLGFAPCTPGRDYRWLFPALPAAHRAAWLAGLVQHELAHCAEQAAAQSDRQSDHQSDRQSNRQSDRQSDRHSDRLADRPADARAAHDVGPAGADGRARWTADALAAGGNGMRWHEVLADLAFALHVDLPRSGSGAQLAALMALLRTQHARQDPAHDTSAELQCYLQQRLQFTPDGPWLQRLQAWCQRCWTGRIGR